MTNKENTNFFSFEQGEVILLDKPLEWTSFDIVNKVKSIIKYRLGLKKTKIGHAGTLDPLASGLLILCTGPFTKKIEQFQASEKEYTGTFFLGASTASSDLETQPDTFFPIDHITPELILATAKSFIGESDQEAPLFSAKKIDGKRAYELARKGSDIKLNTHRITITEFEITRIELPEIDFRIVCSKGTYIRSIARDFGKALNSGAYLSALRRTRIGSFDVRQAFTPEEFEFLVRRQEEGIKDTESNDNNHS